MVSAGYSTDAYTSQKTQQPAIEVCTINGRVWSIGQPFRLGVLQWSWGFYDPQTGEVWGTRVLVGVEPVSWDYEPRPKSLMDMTFYVETVQDKVPIGLIAARIVGWWQSRKSAPIIPE